MLLNKFLYKLLVITTVLVFYVFNSCSHAQEVKSVDVKGDEVSITLIGIKDTTKLKVTIGGRPMEIISIDNLSEVLLLVKGLIPNEITPRYTNLDIKNDGISIDSRYVNITPRWNDPELIELKPLGGIEGATITIVGKNLGENSEQVSILLERWGKVADKMVFTEIRPPIKPISLYPPDEKGQQKLKFTIPSGRDLVAKNWISNKIKMRIRVIVNEKTSNYKVFNVIQSNWKWKTITLSILLIVVLLSVLGITMGKWTFLKLILIERKTKTISLSKFQAFCWTIVFIGSYFYLAIGKGLFLGTGMIQDFNPSLIVLMSISYGGLLTSRGISTWRSKNDLEGSPLGLINLVSEGGEISLPRLQLVGFTVTTIIIYIYNLSGANLFVEGLPEVPPTLLGLLGVSQTGYLGGKVLGGRLVVNYVVPRKVQVGCGQNADLILTGSGFIANTKSLFQGDNQLQDTVFENSNSLTVKIPELTQPGWKQLVLVPPTGSSVLLNDIVEAVDPKIEKVKRVGGKDNQILLTLKDFNLKKIECTIPDNPSTIIDRDEVNNVVTVEAEMKINNNDKIEIKSTEYQFQADIILKEIL